MCVGLDNISRSTRGSEKRTGGILRASVGRRKDRETLSHSMLEGILRVNLLQPYIPYTLADAQSHIFEQLYAVRIAKYVADSSQACKSWHI